MRRQDAIYWPPGPVDSYGRLTVGPLVELVSTSSVNYRVRWEDKVEEFVDREGTTQASTAVVCVGVLPDGSDVALGGWLWLGRRTDLTSEVDPRENSGAFEVRRVEHSPDLRATKILRMVYL